MCIHAVFQYACVVKEYLSLINTLTCNKILLLFLDFQSVKTMFKITKGVKKRLPIAYSLTLYIKLIN